MIDEAAWDAAAALHEAALAHLEQGELDAAERLAREAVGALDRAVGPAHPDAANARCTLALIATIRAQYARAATLAREAIDALRAQPVEPVVDAVRRVAFTRLAEADLRLGAYAEAEEAIDAALALARVGSEDPMELAQIQDTRGVLLKSGGRYDEARAAYEEARRAYEAAGLHEPATLLHNLAGLACACDEFVEAEGLARRAIAARGEDDEPLALAQDIAGLGDALAGQGRATEAEASYRDAIARMRAIAPEHPEIGYALHNLADLLSEVGRDQDAVAAYREAIAHKARALGERHHEVAASEANLAALLAPRDAAAARALAVRAAASVASLPPSHPVRVGCESLTTRLAEA